MLSGRTLISEAPRLLETALSPRRLEKPVAWLYLCPAVHFTDFITDVTDK